jgi:hypothetical protein
VKFGDEFWNLNKALLSILAGVLWPKLEEIMISSLE